MHDEHEAQKLDNEIFLEKKRFIKDKIKNASLRVDLIDKRTIEDYKRKTEKVIIGNELVERECLESEKAHTLFELEKAKQKAVETAFLLFNHGKQKTESVNSNTHTVKAGFKGFDYFKDLPSYQKKIKEMDKVLDRVCDVRESKLRKDEKNCRGMMLN